MISSTGLNGIVVAVDGSAPGKVATDWAARQASMHHVPLTVVHVMPPPAIAMWPEVAVLEGFSDWRKRHAAEVLGEAKDVARQAVGETPLDIEIKSIAGPTIPTLVDISKDAALVVVGCRGLSTVRRRLLGSVSSGLVHHAHCPVAVIHDEDPLMDGPAQAPVLLGIDGSPASELATAIAFDEASRRGVTLIAMHSWADDELYGWRGGLDWEAQRSEGQRALAERLAGWQERFPDVVVDRRLIFGRSGRALARGVRIGATDCAGQPWARRVRGHAAGVGQCGGGGGRQDAGDRRAAELIGTQASLERGRSSFVAKTAA